MKLWECFNDENSIDSIIFSNDSIWIPISDYPSYYASWENSYSNFVVDTSHYTNAVGEVSVIAALTISAGETVVAESQIYDRPIYHELSATLYPGEQIKIQDTYQAMMAIPLRHPTSGIWNIMLTRKPLNFDVLSAYQPWASTLPITLTGNTWSFRALEFSKDGNYLYFAFNSTLYRISNLQNSRTQEQLDFEGVDYNLTIESIYSFSSTVNAISIDPNNADRVMVLLSGFGSNNVYLSSNATSSSPTFAGKQGSLPSMPAFSAVINKYDGNQVVVGTEYGVYSTEDITASNPVWVDQNGNGMDYVLTLHIRQQLFDNSYANNVDNDGVIYIGTHGRGIFSSDAWKGPEAIDEPTNNFVSSNNNTIKVFPNPVSSNTTINFTSNSTDDIWVNVYNLQGSLVMKENIGSYPVGKQSIELSFDNLQSGTYVLSIYNKNLKASAKIIKL